MVAFVQHHSHRPFATPQRRLQAAQQAKVRLGKGLLWRCLDDGTPIYAPTAGKAEAGAPTYTVNIGARGYVGPFTLGVSAKRTGPRYITDDNLPTYTGFFVPGQSGGSQEDLKRHLLATLPPP